MNNLNFFSDYLIATLRLAVPLAFAALGGLYSERSGVLNIALEGMLLTGALLALVGLAGKSTPPERLRANAPYQNTKEVEINKELGINNS
jgi:ABC-type uncharacterized transport system permease subunit